MEIFPNDCIRISGIRYFQGRNGTPPSHFCDISAAKTGSVFKSNVISLSQLCDSDQAIQRPVLCPLKVRGNLFSDNLRGKDWLLHVFSQHNSSHEKTSSDPSTFDFALINANLFFQTKWQYFHCEEKPRKFADTNLDNFRSMYLCSRLAWHSLQTKPNK